MLKHLCAVENTAFADKNCEVGAPIYGHFAVRHDCIIADLVATRALTRAISMSEWIDKVKTSCL